MKILEHHNKSEIVTHDRVASNSARLNSAKSNKTLEVTTLNSGASLIKKDCYSK